MISRLPSLRAVAIFVTAGRALSFTTAAKAMNVTPSAVSRRIRDLEHELGTTLFRRFNRRLELTAAGTRYLAAVGPAIDTIAGESEAVRPRRRVATLRLSVLQSFASLWLLPRMAASKALRPDIVAERLFRVKVFAVAAPGLLPASATACAAILDRTTLLGIAQAPDLWPQYLAGIGLGSYRPRHTQTFENAQVMYAAAANGLGLALGARELLEGDLERGRLVEAFSHAPVPVKQSYHLVFASNRRDQPALRALRRALAAGAESRVR